MTNNKMIRFPPLHILASLSTPPPHSSSPRRWFHLSARMQLWISRRIHLRQTLHCELGAAETLTACLGHTHTQKQKLCRVYALMFADTWLLKTYDHSCQVRLL